MQVIDLNHQKQGWLCCVVKICIKQTRRGLLKLVTAPIGFAILGWSRLKSIGTTAVFKFCILFLFEFVFEKQTERSWLCVERKCWKRFPLRWARCCIYPLVLFSVLGIQFHQGRVPAEVCGPLNAAICIPLCATAIWTVSIINSASYSTVYFKRTQQTHGISADRCIVHLC